MESTVIIALITAFAAIISPLITAVINNKYGLAMKQIEAEEYRLTNITLHEREVLEKALTGIGLLMSWQDPDSIKESCKNILTAVAYVDSNTGSLLMDIVDSVMDPEESLDIFVYREICELMKDEIAKRTGIGQKHNSNNMRMCYGKTN